MLTTSGALLHIFVAVFLRPHKKAGLKTCARWLVDCVNDLRIIRVTYSCGRAKPTMNNYVKATP